MKRCVFYLALAVLLLLSLAGCGEVPTAPPGEDILRTEPSVSTPTAAVAPPTSTPKPTRTPVPRPTPAPPPTGLVVQPTPYAPTEALPAGFPMLAYAVQRPQQPAQLWTLRYECGLLREELLLDLTPTVLESRIGSTPYAYIGYSRVERAAFSPDGCYLAMGLDFGTFQGTTLIIHIADGRVYLPSIPEVGGVGFLAWVPGDEWFVWQGMYGATWGVVAIDGSDNAGLPTSHVLDAAASLDGRRLIFSAIPSENIWLGRVDVDGRNLTSYRLVEPLPGGYIRNLQLSPDGRLCAFTREHQVTYRGEGQVWVMDADGSDQRPLGPADTDDYDLAWSPDGRTLAFARWDRPDPQVSPYDRAARVSSLWLIDVESGAQRLLLASEGQYAHWSPQWLPDGSGLVFLSTRGGEANLWFVHPDGTGQQQLTRQGGLTGEVGISPR